MLLQVKKVYKSVGGGGVFSFWLLAVGCWLLAVGR
jgi:hypothetical protein